MLRRVYSLETEYALAYQGPLAKPLATVQSKTELYELLEAELLAQGPCCVCDPTQRESYREGEPMIQIREGYFLANGARLYFDTGHLEWAAPETSDPYQALIYDRAGELELAAAAAAVPAGPAAPARRAPSAGEPDRGWAGGSARRGWWSRWGPGASLPGCRAAPAGRRAPPR